MNSVKIRIYTEKKFFFFFYAIFFFSDMEIHEFFRNQNPLNISLPKIYYEKNFEWFYNEIVPGIIIKTSTTTDFPRLQEINFFQNQLIGWINMIQLNLAWQHNSERAVLLQLVQKYVNEQFPTIQSPTFITRTTNTCKQRLLFQKLTDRDE